MTRYIPKRLSLLVVLLFLAATIVSPALYAQEEEEKKKEEKQDEIIRELELLPIHIAMLERGRTVGRLTIELIIDTKTPEDYADVKKRRPQIRNDFITSLNLLTRQYLRINRPIDPELIAAVLNDPLERRVGRGRARVYVQRVLIEAD